MKLNKYKNKIVSLTLKNGNIINGRIRKFGSTYTVAGSTISPADVTSIIVKGTTGNKAKKIKSTRICTHIYKETFQRNDGTCYDSYRIQYANNSLNLIKRFKTLEDAQNYKCLCEQYSHKQRFVKEDMKHGNALGNDLLDYPENILNDMGVLPESYENYYTEIIPSFDKNFETVCERIRLSEREIEIINGFYKNQILLSDLGKNLNITRERVRQIKDKTIAKLSHKGVIKTFLVSSDKYALISMEEREEMKKELLAKMTYELALEIVNNHNEELFTNSKDMDITELDLSVRSYNCLKRAGIDCVSKLCNMNYEKVLKIRNLGKKSLKEIKEKLAELGLSFKEQEEQYL